MSRVQAIVLASAVALLVSVLNLVRRRQLREEYSWLWLLASVSFFLLTVSSAIYTWIARLIGASNTALAFTFLGLYFLVFISIQFSVQLSRLVTRSKDLAQEIAILDGEIRRLQQHMDTRAHLVGGETDGDGKEPGEATVSRSVKHLKDEVTRRGRSHHIGAVAKPTSESEFASPSGARDHAERAFD